MKKTLLMIVAALALVLSPGAYADSGDTSHADNLHPVIDAWQSSDAPIVLIKAENFIFNERGAGTCGYFNEHPFTRLDDDYSRLIIGKVVISNSKKLAPGTMVLLEVPGKNNHAGDLDWWLADSRDAFNLTDDGRIVYINGCDFRAFNGKLLLMGREKLREPFKAMLSEVVKKEA